MGVERVVSERFRNLCQIRLFTRNPRLLEAVAKTGQTPPDPLIVRPAPLLLRPISVLVHGHQILVPSDHVLVLVVEVVLLGVDLRVEIRPGGAATGPFDLARENPRLLVALLHVLSVIGFRWEMSGHNVIHPGICLTFETSQLMPLCVCAWKRVIYHRRKRIFPF
jgi:hypothetical protein